MYFNASKTSERFGLVGSKTALNQCHTTQSRFKTLHRESSIDERSDYFLPLESRHREDFEISPARVKFNELCMKRRL